MQAYLWIKSAHLLFVMAWVAAVFYLPRILMNLVEAGDQPLVRDRLVLMGRRLNRFGHVMLGLAVVAGLVLWLGYRVIPDFPTMVGAGSGWLRSPRIANCLRSATITQLPSGQSRTRS